MKKSHIIASVILALGCIVLNYLPKLSADSLQRLLYSEREISNVEDSGVTLSSSGFRSNRPLVAVHETFSGILVPSSTWILGQVLIQTTGTINLLADGTSYFLNTASGLPTGIITQSGFFKQPNHPRQLEFILNGATGSVVIIGTGAFGQSIRDTLTLTSGTKQFTHEAFAMISSFTVTIATTIVDRSTYSLSIGISTGIGLTYKYDFFSSSSLIRASENGSFLSLSSYTLNSSRNFYMVNLATSHAQLPTSVYAPREVHYLNRQTLYGE